MSNYSLIPFPSIELAVNLFPHSWPIGHTITYHHIASPDVIHGPVLVVDIEHATDKLIVSSDTFTGQCYGLPQLTTRFTVVTTNISEAQQ